MFDEAEQFIQTESGYCYYDVTGEKPVVYNLFVNPDSRGHGKARKLLELVIRIIRDTGYTGDILIEAKPMEKVGDKQHLRRFYESMGLVVIKDEK
jgi:GNAT superfamily N-acetyltransferase